MNMSFSFENVQLRCSTCCVCLHSTTQCFCVSRFTGSDRELAPLHVTVAPEINAVSVDVSADFPGNPCFSLHPVPALASSGPEAHGKAFGFAGKFRRTVR